MEVAITLPLLLLFYYVTCSSAASNIALNQPSWQSGIYNHPYTLLAVSSKAFDGNTNPYLANGSCSHTDQVDNPWLAVDLEYSRLVYRVDVTNRVTLSSHFTNVRMGTSDTSPEIQTPALTNFDVCHSYNGNVGAGATQGFYCGSKGRYLIIQLQTPYEVLNVCEVQVFEERSEMYMEAVAGQRLTRGHSLSPSLQDVSSAKCGIECRRNYECSSFNYQPTSRTCELLSSTFDEEATSLVADPAWTWYGRRSLF